MPGTSHSSDNHLRSSDNLHALAVEAAMMPASDIDLGVLRLCAHAALPLAVDRIAVLRASSDPDQLMVTHVWTAPSPQGEVLPQIRVLPASLSWLLAGMQGCSMIVDASTDRSLLTREDRSFLDRMHLTGIAGVPMKIGDVHGVLVAISTRLAGAWDASDLEYLHKFVGLVEALLARRAAEEHPMMGDPRWGTAMGNGGGGIWEWDAITDNIWFSEQWCAMVGYHPAAVENSAPQLRELIHPGDVGRVMAQLNQHLEDPSAEYRIRYRLRRTDDAWIWVLSRGFSTERDGNGRTTRMIGVDVDITAIMLEEEELTRDRDALRQALDELRTTTQARSEFLTSISHELRTPLTVILGMTDVLCMQNTPALTTRQLGFVQTIQESGRHLLSLIEDLIEASSFERHSITLNLQSVRIDDVCGLIMGLAGPLAQHKNLNLSCRIDPPDLVIQADPTRLRQALRSLIDNAIKFTPEGGEVSVHIHRDNHAGECVIEVRDSGIGIPETELSRLFQPFSMSGEDRLNGMSRTGLGLAIVQHIVTLHHGHISVASTPGTGSCFTIRLPLIIAEA